MKDQESTATFTVVTTSSDGNISVTSPPNAYENYDICPNCKRYFPVSCYGFRCPICGIELEKKT
jgi:hypothetical protein